MPKLVVMKGLPGSGKSTIAEDMLSVNPGMVRVNRDMLRPMLHGNAAWSRERERKTVEIETYIVRTALYNGTSVVVDDTNIAVMSLSHWINLTEECNSLSVPVTMETHDLTKKVSILECIRRDSLRSEPARVGRGVIDRMALYNSLADLSKEEKVAIVDIDGTLANLDHRLHFLETAIKNYDAFYSEAAMDSPIEPIWKAVRQLVNEDHTIIIVSGRPVSIGHITAEWLLGKEYQTEHMAADWSIRPDYLFMRQTGDHRPDSVVKREILDTMFKKAGLRKGAIKVVIDDRDSTCAVWEEAGLPWIQVDHGACIRCGGNSVQLLPRLGIPINY